MEIRKGFQPRGKYLDEMNIGDKVVTPSRTITEADIMSFAGLSGDFSVMHIDRVAAKSRGFPDIIAHGLLTLSIASGLRLQTGIMEGTSLALLGVEAKFTRPVCPGDTITCTLEVIDKRLTQKPDRGILKIRLEAFNQRDEPVMEVIYTTMASASRPKA